MPSTTTPTVTTSTNLNEPCRRNGDGDDTTAARRRKRYDGLGRRIVGMGAGGTFNVTFTGAGIVAGRGHRHGRRGDNLNAKVDLVNGNAINLKANTNLGTGARGLAPPRCRQYSTAPATPPPTFLYGTKATTCSMGAAAVDTAVYWGSQAGYSIVHNPTASHRVR